MKVLNGQLMDRLLALQTRKPELAYVGVNFCMAASCRDTCSGSCENSCAGGCENSCSGDDCMGSCAGSCEESCYSDCDGFGL